MKLTFFVSVFQSIQTSNHPMYHDIDEIWLRLKKALRICYGLQPFFEKTTFKSKGKCFFYKNLPKYQVVSKNTSVIGF